MRSKFIAFFLMLLFVGCTSEINQPLSKLANQLTYPKAPTPKNSTIYLPISIPLSELQNLVNDKVGKVLLSKNEIDADKVLIENLEVYRTGAITLSSKQNHLFWEVPLRFKLLITPKQKALQFNFLKQIELNFGLSFTLKSKVELQSNYHLKTTTALKSYTWEREPEVSFGKFHFSLTKALAKQIEDNKHELIHKLDSLIAQKVDLKKTVDQIWMNIQTPKPIEKQFNLFWIKIEPQTISSTQPVFKQNEINIPLSLEAKMQVVVDSQPPYIEPSPLPKLNMVTKQKEVFEINLLGRLPYGVINKHWKSFIPSTNFKVEGEDLSINSLRLFGYGDKIGIEIKTKGLTEATVVFSGKPLIDKQDWVLRIADFDYEMTESDLIAQGAELLYGEDFKKMVKQLLYFPLKTQLMILPTVLQDGLNKGDKSDQRLFEIEEMDFETYSPIILKEALFIELKATGKANMRIQSIN